MPSRNYCPLPKLLNFLICKIRLELSTSSRPARFALPVNGLKSNCPVILNLTLGVMSVTREKGKTGATR